MAQLTDSCSMRATLSLPRTVFYGAFIKSMSMQSGLDFDPDPKSPGLVSA